ncbi:succinate dehydrogenase cytochrome b subunit [Haliangium sp.]|uniref:succinate dehydrogenase cytochrome b subunit n=1 Tax=Haliangium sp. TaxID=2663208 RepID=UPI003D10EB23
MSWVSSYVRSSVGAKHIMAVTGLGLALFVLVHMLGNLALLAGQDAINAYAASLKGTPPLLWGTRIGLLVIVVIHISAAYRLTLLNRAARPVKYVRFEPRRSPFYARAMPMTGLILLAFIIFHLLHYTIGVITPETFSLTDAQGRHDVYSMAVYGFQNPIIAGWYMLAMVLLCFHLAHGVTSLFQSLGINHPKYNRAIGYAGPAFAAVVFLGNSAIVLSVLLGVVTLPGA